MSWIFYDLHSENAGILCIFLLLQKVHVKLSNTFFCSEQLYISLIMSTVYFNSELLLTTYLYKYELT